MLLIAYSHPMAAVIKRADTESEQIAVLKTSAWSAPNAATMASMTCLR
jgi:hypothetical protein